MAVVVVKAWLGPITDGWKCLECHAVWPAPDHLTRGRCNCADLRRASRMPCEIAREQVTVTYDTSVYDIVLGPWVQL